MENRFIRAEEVADELGVSKPYAYTPVWNGSATELVALLDEDMQPNILTRRLNVKAGELLNEYSIEYTVKRTRSGSFISLARKAV